MTTPKIHPIQAMIDGMNAAQQRERMLSQMTLGTLLARLYELPGALEIETFNNPHSYRGYYCDLAFESVVGQTMLCDDLRLCCEGCMGEVFTGYKGGDYQMGRNTPVWIAGCGCCGNKLVGISDDGKLVLGEDA